MKLNSSDIKRLKVRTEIIRQYYVRDGDWIYAGPFETKQEAEQALSQAKKIDSETIPL